MSNPKQKGHIVVLSGPSGVGKSTVITAVKRERPNLALSVSHTSRDPRVGEENGVNYHFVSDARFEQMIREDAFLEYTRYQGHYYGTSFQAIDELLEANKDVLLDIEVEGAANVRQCYPEAIEIFILPPSFEELSRRLHARGTDSEEVIQGRLRRAHEEFQCIPHYDYLVVNDNVEVAVKEILAILTAADCTVKARRDVAEKMMKHT